MTGHRPRASAVTSTSAELVERIGRAARQTTAD